MQAYILAAIWAAIFIGALWLEAETCEMVAIWFVPGALAAIILALCDTAWWLQLIVFIAMSLLFLVLARPLLKRYMKKNGADNKKTDTDLLIGRVVKVEEDIVNIDEKGSVKVGGQIWSARMSDDAETAAVGETVIVEEIRGVKLICRRH